MAGLKAKPPRMKYDQLESTSAENQVDKKVMLKKL